MISNKVPQLPDVYLVSKLDKSAFLLKEHLENRARLVYVAEASLVFDEGKAEICQCLLKMFETGAERNQVVMLIPAEERQAVFDTASLWTNWGGVVLPIIHSVQHTLEMIEEELLNGNIPLENQCIERGHDFNVKE